MMPAPRSAPSFLRPSAAPSSAVPAVMTRAAISCARRGSRPMAMIVEVRPPITPSLKSKKPLKSAMNREIVPMSQFSFTPHETPIPAKPSATSGPSFNQSSTRGGCFPHRNNVKPMSNKLMTRMYQRSTNTARVIKRILCPLMAVLLTGA